MDDGGWAVREAVVSDPQTAELVRVLRSAASRAGQALTMLDLCDSRAATLMRGGFPDSLRLAASLVTVRVARVPMADEGITRLARALRHLPNLRALDVSSTRMTSDGLRMIMPLLGGGVGGAPSLTQLRLSGNDISDDGADCIAASLASAAGCSLRTLAANSCGIGPLGARALAQAIRQAATSRPGSPVRRSASPAVKRCKLKSLSIRGNPIKDEGAAALLDSVSRARARGGALCALDLAQCGISDRAAGLAAVAIARLVRSAGQGGGRRAAPPQPRGSAVEGTPKAVVVSAFDWNLSSNRFSTAACALLAATASPLLLGAPASGQPTASLFLRGCFAGLPSPPASPRARRRRRPSRYTDASATASGRVARASDAAAAAVWSCELAADRPSTPDLAASVVHGRSAANGALHGRPVTPPARIGARREDETGAVVSVVSVLAAAMRVARSGWSGRTQRVWSLLGWAADAGALGADNPGGGQREEEACLRDAGRVARATGLGGGDGVAPSLVDRVVRGVSAAAADAAVAGGSAPASPHGRPGTDAGMPARPQRADCLEGSDEEETSGGDSRAEDEHGAASGDSRPSSPGAGFARLGGAGSGRASRAWHAPIGAGWPIPSSMWASPPASARVRVALPPSPPTPAREASATPSPCPVAQPSRSPAAATPDSDASGDDDGIVSPVPSPRPLRVRMPPAGVLRRKRAPRSPGVQRTRPGVERRPSASDGASGPSRSPSPDGGRPSSRSAWLRGWERRRHARVDGTSPDHSPPLSYGVPTVVTSSATRHRARWDGAPSRAVSAGTHAAAAFRGQAVTGRWAGGGRASSARPGAASIAETDEPTMVESAASVVDAASPENTGPSAVSPGLLPEPVGEFGEFAVRARPRRRQSSPALSALIGGGADVLQAGVSGWGDASSEGSSHGGQSLPLGLPDAESSPEAAPTPGVQASHPGGWRSMTEDAVPSPAGRSSVGRRSMTEDAVASPAGRFPGTADHSGLLRHHTTRGVLAETAAASSSTDSSGGTTSFQGQLGQSARPSGIAGGGTGTPALPRESLAGRQSDTWAEPGAGSDASSGESDLGRDAVLTLGQLLRMRPAPKQRAGGKEAAAEPTAAARQPLPPQRSPSASNPRSPSRATALPADPAALASAWPVPAHPAGPASSGPPSSASSIVMEIVDPSRRFATQFTVPGLPPSRSRSPVRLPPSAIGHGPTEGDRIRSLLASLQSQARGLPVSARVVPAHPRHEPAGRGAEQADGTPSDRPSTPPEQAWGHQTDPPPPTRSASPPARSASPAGRSASPPTRSPAPHRGPGRRVATRHHVPALCTPPPHHVPFGDSHARPDGSATRGRPMRPTWHHTGRRSPDGPRMRVPSVRQSSRHGRPARSAAGPGSLTMSGATLPALGAASRQSHAWGGEGTRRSQAGGQRSPDGHSVAGADGRSEARSRVRRRHRRQQSPASDASSLSGHESDSSNRSGPSAEHAPPDSLGLHPAVGAGAGVWEPVIAETGAEDDGPVTDEVLGRSRTDPGPPDAEPAVRSSQTTAEMPREAPGGPIAGSRAADAQRAVASPPPPADSKPPPLSMPAGPPAVLGPTGLRLPVPRRRQRRVLFLGDAMDPRSPVPTAGRPQGPRAPVHSGDGHSLRETAGRRGGRARAGEGRAGCDDSDGSDSDDGPAPPSVHGLTLALRTLCRAGRAGPGDPAAPRESVPCEVRVGSGATSWRRGHIDVSPVPGSERVTLRLSLGERSVVLGSVSLTRAVVLVDAASATAMLVTGAASARARFRLSGSEASSQRDLFASPVAALAGHELRSDGPGAGLLASLSGLGVAWAVSAA